jgi:hypothetical protein
MKRTIRRFLAFMMLGPQVLWTRFLSIFIGKERAINLCGPFFTKATMPFSRNWVPKLQCASDFDSFSSKMQKNFWLWKPFFDFTIAQNDSDVFKLEITYCPICDVIQMLGLPDLAPYVCEADWQVAKENEEKWIFQRKYQLSTGDSHCDHTYLRKTGKQRQCLDKK